MSSKILGIGTALPGCVLPQSRAASIASRVSGHNPEETERLAFLYGLTGIERRHVTILDEGEAVPDAFAESVDGPSTAWRMERYDRLAPPLAHRSCMAALEAAAVPAKAVTHLVTVSCTGFSAPGVDLKLVRSLDLSPIVERTHVGFMGCHGALNGLRVVQALAASIPEAVVLLCATELCSLHFTYGPGSDRSVSNALFADGSAALVATSVEEDSENRWRIQASGSVLIPETSAAMTWTVGDQGFAMTLAPEVPRLIRQHLRPWLTTWLGGHGLTPEDVASWAVHPGGPKILDAVRDTLELPNEALADSRAVLSAHGNMSSPTLLFILQRMMRRGAPRPCVALGFGPGLVVEATLFG